MLENSFGAKVEVKLSEADIDSRIDSFTKNLVENVEGVGKYSFLKNPDYFYGLPEVTEEELLQAQQYLIDVGVELTKTLRLVGNKEVDIGDINKKISEIQALLKTIPMRLAVVMYELKLRQN